MTMHDAPDHLTDHRMDTRSLANIGVGIAATVIVLDQFTKLLIDAIIGPERSRSAWWFINDQLGFEYVRNRGVAFGIKIGGSTMTIIVSCLAFVIIGALFWRFASKDRFAAIGVGLLIGGAIGNIIDRLRFDAVVDFIAIGPWPRFNIADSAITLGVLILAWSASAGHHEPAETTDKEQSSYGGKRPVPE